MYPPYPRPLHRSYVADLNEGLDSIPTRGPVSKYSLKSAVRSCVLRVPPP